MADISYSEALIEQNRLLGELLRGADWATPVPTCPGWTLLQLLRHVGRGDRWAAQIISEGSGEVDPRQVPGGRPPDDEAGAIEWLLAGPSALLEAVATCGPSTPAWTFVGPQPAQWWIRRRLHEATVHRADVAMAIGSGYDLDPDIAADGISEWLSLVAVMGSTEPGETITLSATDGLGEWTIGDAGALDVTLRGRTVDLLLALAGRTPATDLDVSGDRDRWERWIGRMSF